MLSIDSPAEALAFRRCVRAKFSLVKRRVAEHLTLELRLLKK